MGDVCGVIYNADGFAEAACCIDVGEEAERQMILGLVIQGGAIPMPGCSYVATTWLKLCWSSSSPSSFVGAFGIRQ